MLYMPTAKVLYAIRMPSDLKTFLDSEARKRGVTTASLVVDACWAYLEEPRELSIKPPSINQTHIGGPYSSVKATDFASTTPTNKPAAPFKMNNAMAAFVAKMPVQTPELIPVEDTPPIPDCRVCEAPMRAVKGKWACSDSSCSMYSLEQRG